MIPRATHAKDTERGFSLVEMIVAIALFTIVMMVSLSALLALIDANRKARALESVINNLNIALDGMVRAMRMGSSYHCGAGTLTQTADCATVPENQIAFLRFGGTPLIPNDYWVYSYNAVTKRIEKKEGVNGQAFAITAPEISIDSMQFFVSGSTIADYNQPKIVMIVKGTAGGERLRTRTTFSIQATAVQRVLDI